MDNQTLNYLVFFILLFIVIYMGCVDRTVFEKLFGVNEKFIVEQEEILENKYDKLEGTHYKIETPLVSRLIEQPKRGWKQVYKDNYLKGNVNYEDSFNGVVTRNYLDNMQFFVN